MVKKHFKCYLWKILWGLGALSLVLAWGSLPTGVIATLGTAVWFWSALILGVLSITIKMDCDNCDVCKVQPQ